MRRADDILLALALTLAGTIELALGSSDGRLVRAIALPLTTLPLALRRTVPLVPLGAIAITLPLQAAFGDFFEAGPQAVTLVAMVIALYSAGRHLGGAGPLTAACGAAAALAATRIGFDPAVADAGAAAITVLGVGMPLLVGRWIAGQARLHREVAATAARRERERERDARDAAEEERMRIAADLQSAIADRLDATVAQAGRLRERLAAGDDATARELLTSIAAAARESLADVRRVLGILRRDGEGATREPPAPAPAAAPSSAAAPTPSPPAAPSSAAPPPAASDDRARLLDRLVVAALLAGAQLELLLVAPASDRAFGILSAFAITLPLLWRRSHPVPVALATLAAVAVQSTVLRLDSFPVADAATLICATYAIGAHAPRREALAGLALLALGIGAHSAAYYPDAVGIAVFGAAIVPWTVGRIMLSQRQLTRTAHEQATEVERARARDARTAVTAERMRVARELHDAVAHNISVIAIQAAGAQGVLVRDPARAAECAALIEEVGRDAITELRRLAGERAGPPPTLARVDALAQRTRDAGLPVELRVEGEREGVSAGIDLAAFRIVQEALANASKHAGAARAWVVVRYDPRAVELEIGDDGRGGASSKSTGHGLIGMRERVALYGGTFDAGRRPGGGFAVRARLPLSGT